MNSEALIEILEESVKRNGEKPLTNKWLLNILKMAQRIEEREDLRSDAYYGLGQDEI